MGHQALPVIQTFCLIQLPLGIKESVRFQAVQIQKPSVPQREGAYIAPELNGLLVLKLADRGLFQLI